MIKDFDTWNDQKKSLDVRAERFFFKSGEVWWCALGTNVGHESCGKGETFRRPVLILKKLSRESCIVIPLTSKEKSGSWFADITLHGEKRVALLSQLRMVSSNRFQRRLAVLDEGDFSSVKRKLEELLEL